MDEKIGAGFRGYEAGVFVVVEPFEGVGLLLGHSAGPRVGDG